MDFGGALGEMHHFGQEPAAVDATVGGHILKFAWPAAAFGIGATAGAFTYLNAAFRALALPLIILLALVPRATD